MVLIENHLFLKQGWSAFSDFLNVLYGVPQMSILSPRLFIVFIVDSFYINDNLDYVWRFMISCDGSYNIWFFYKLQPVCRVVELLGRISLVHDMQSNDSQSYDTRFIHKLYLLLYAINRLAGGYRIKNLKDFT